MRRRRTVRHFSDRPVPRAELKTVSVPPAPRPAARTNSPGTSRSFRIPTSSARFVSAQKMKSVNLTRRAPEEWLHELEKFETDANKPYLDIAPYLIAVFAQPYARRRRRHHQTLLRH